MLNFIGKKNEECPFSKIDKTSVIQDTRVFSQSGIKINQLIAILTKLLFVLYNESKFNVKEATEVFFSITRLFQIKNSALRRLVYVAIKELSHADHALVVTSSLTKDITVNEDCFKGPAIRALVSITDKTNIHGIERFLKQALVDKNPTISSAAMVSMIHISSYNLDIAKHCANEIAENIHSPYSIVQYHALGLLYIIKQRDQLAIMKLVRNSTNGNISFCSSYAIMMLIRYVVALLEHPDNTKDTFLENCLRHSDEIIVYEAAVVYLLSNGSDRLLTLAISVLQLLLNSSKVCSRFASIKVLSQVALKAPLALSSCSLDLESLIQDNNKTISMMAITTLLRTGSEGSIDKLISQIWPLMDNIDDLFKKEVVSAIGELIFKFPKRQELLMEFLANKLSDGALNKYYEGCYEYKLEIVNTLINVITKLPSAKEIGLLHLCEFIEDCDYPSLCSKILLLIGEECPSLLNPSRVLSINFIKYIHNRIILDGAEIRAAAVSSLAKFALKCPELTSAVTVLLSYCKFDMDDEVRDRSTLFVQILSGTSLELSKLFISNDELPVSLDSLESFLIEYLNTSDFSHSFDIKNVPLETKSISLPTNNSNLPPSSKTSSEDHSFLFLPEFSKYGSMFKSCSSVMLTECETEYVVQVIKHIFLCHIVLEFKVKNTISEVTLTNLRMSVDSEFQIESVVPIEELHYNEEKSIFVGIKLPEDIFSCLGTFANVLKFNCIENNSKGYEDEYRLEDFELQLSDHIVPLFTKNFIKDWENLKETEECEVYNLTSMKSLQDAIPIIIGYFDMYPCENSEFLMETVTLHTLLLSGIFRGNQKILMKVQMEYSPLNGVQTQLMAKCSNKNVSVLFVSSLE